MFPYCATGTFHLAVCRTLHVHGHWFNDRRKNAAVLQDNSRHYLQKWSSIILFPAWKPEASFNMSNH